MLNEFLQKVIEIATTVGSKILLAAIVLIVGIIVIRVAIKGIKKIKALEKLDATVRGFVLSGIKWVLYIVLLVAVIGILGIPMASVITVIASCGVTIGLALQGAFSNLAGGIMLIIFRPFKDGDYIEAAGGEGTVQEINLFYTVLLTLDNKRITIPNGSLMNANVTNYSTEDLRRVDHVFTVAKTEIPAEIQKIMVEAAAKTDKVVTAPEPFARFSGGSDQAMEFTVRAWCKNADYWDVYYDLAQNVVEALGAAGVAQPAARITVENK